MEGSSPSQSEPRHRSETIDLNHETITTEKNMLKAIKDLTNHILLAIGACLNMGGRMVQHIAGDYPNGSPQDILEARLSENKLVSLLVKLAPNVDRHPNMLILVCMDSRFHVSNLFSDTRAGMIDVLRSPGSIVTDESIEQIRLAIDKHHVKVVIILRHTDCAMEKVAADPESRKDYPLLSNGVDTREIGIRKLLDDSLVRDRIAKGDLLVITGMVDTSKNRIIDYRNAMDLLATSNKTSDQSAHSFAANE